MPLYKNSLFSTMDSHKYGKNPEFLHPEASRFYNILLEASKLEEKSGCVIYCYRSGDRFQNINITSDCKTRYLLTRYEMANWDFFCEDIAKHLEVFGKIKRSEPIIHHPGEDGTKIWTEIYLVGGNNVTVVYSWHPSQEKMMCKE